ncbi:hypothetical protein SNE40_015630 [Patella caerulea]|uniref:Myeloid leukemia factor n=1 Tax=Patella caerulea TaxID=87958 RepID=A0AAN8JP78_PATCE
MLRSPFMRDFEEDPFFAAHRDHMMSMGSMFSMPDPFSRPQIQDSRLVERERRSRDRRHQLQRQQMQQPSPLPMMSFGFNGMLSNMEKMMSDMHKQFEQPLVTPVGGGHNFTQSSFVSYSNVGQGAPRVYQASSSQRCRGGVVETKKTERDSRTGVEKVVIGHKIGERVHKIEKQNNRLTGEQVENQEFINLEEEEAEKFDQEFQDNIRKTMPVRGGADHIRRHRVNPTEGQGHSHSHSYTQRPPRQILPPTPRYRSYRDRN